MHPFFKRFFGVSFILFAILGILFSTAGVYGIWQVRVVAQQKFSETSQIVDDVLLATYQGLSSADDMLAEVIETIDSSQTVLLSMSQTMGNFSDILTNFLGGIRLFMPGLNQGGNSLEDTAENMVVFETELTNIADNFTQVNGAMVETRAVMGDYQKAVADSRAQLQELQANGVRWITILAWTLTVLLVWFAITQIGFIILGVEFIRSAKEAGVRPFENPASKA